MYNNKKGVIQWLNWKQYVSNQDGENIYMPTKICQEDNT